MPARTPIADLEEIFEIDIDEDDVDTVYGLLTKLLGRVPIVGSSAVTRGLRMTAVDSAGRRKKVSTIVVEPAHVEGVDETETRNEEHADDAEKASDNEQQPRRLPTIPIPPRPFHIGPVSLPWSGVLTWASRR